MNSFMMRPLRVDGLVTQWLGYTGSTVNVPVKA